MLKSYCQDIYPLLCKKYPNRKIYVIGDHHFFHENILSYTRSNFSSLLEMHQYIINKHNEIVLPEDIVIFLGDFSFKNNFIKDLLLKMNGHKFLLMGNHDKENLVRNASFYGFEGIFTTPIKIQDDYLSHEPLIKGERKDLQFQCIVKEFSKAIGLNYHGHYHTETFLSTSYKNVACEIISYKPFLIGETTVYFQEEKPSFINSSYFNKILQQISEKHTIDPSILISDYLYSFMIETGAHYSNSFFIQGSFGLLKKYQYISNMSDLDISYLYNSLISKEKNLVSFRNFVDSVYESLKSIEGINISFMKRFVSLRIFEVLFAEESFFSKCYFDANLLFLDCYKVGDFISLEGETLMQKYLDKKNSSLLSEFSFPQFQVKSLSLEADIVNLVLQFLFELGHPHKKNILLKKLQYIYTHSNRKDALNNLEDIFIRFFLRNISLLCTLNRTREIEYIKTFSDFKDMILPNISQDLHEKLSAIFNSFSFKNVFEEIRLTPTRKILDKSAELMKNLK